MTPAAPACLRNFRRLSALFSFISLSKNKKGARLRRAIAPRSTNAFALVATAIGRTLLISYAIDVPMRLFCALRELKHQLGPSPFLHQAQQHTAHGTVPVQQNSLSH
jgi:hypothetical protein